MSASDLSGELFNRIAKKAGIPAERVPAVRRRHPAYESLTEFKRAVYSRYEHARHLALLDEYLTKVTRYVETLGAEGIGRLIIAMPPRHGKTLTTSRLYPIWHLGRNPRHRVMLVSYGQSLANKNSRAARNIVKSKAYWNIFPATALAADSQSVMEWNIADTDEEGGADALGVGGAATGKGAHLLIIDDPIKNREQAESDTYRQKVWDAYTDDLYTRLEPGGAVIVMATRWHEDDLTGRLLKNEPDKWTVLELPALAFAPVEDEVFIPDVLGREPGEALWPERYPVPVLIDIKATLGDYGWASLYEQRPRPSEGGILKKAWFKPYVKFKPEIERSIRYWDLAMSEKTSADYTAGVKIGRGKDGLYYVLDVVRERVELARLPELLIDVMLADGAEVHQGFEAKGYMTRALQTVVKDRRLARHVIKGYDVDSDKMTRILPFAARAALDVVRVLDFKNADTYIDELASFPNGAHDDMVDATSGAWGMINEEKKKPKRAEVKRWA